MQILLVPHFQGTQGRAARALRQFWEKTGQQGRIGWQPSISVADHMGLPNDLRDLSEMGILMDVTHHETPHGVGYGTA